MALVWGHPLVDLEDDHFSNHCLEGSWFSLDHFGLSASNEDAICQFHIPLPLLDVDFSDEATHDVLLNPLDGLSLVWIVPLEAFPRLWGVTRGNRAAGHRHDSRDQDYQFSHPQILPHLLTLHRDYSDVPLVELMTHAQQVSSLEKRRGLGSPLG